MIQGREVAVLSLSFSYLFSSLVDDRTIKRRIGNKEDSTGEKMEGEINAT